MEDMELVIKIPKEVYKHLLRAKSVPDMLGIDIVNTINAVKKGIPLPKGHGRLIDKDALMKDYGNPDVEILLDNMDTILKADEAESEDKT